MNLSPCGFKIVTVFFMLVIGSSCTMPDREDLVGQWEPPGEPPYTIIGGVFKRPLRLTKVPRIILKEDSTLVFVDVPAELLGCTSHSTPYEVSDQIISGVGKWSVEDPWGTAITLEIKEINGELRHCRTDRLRAESFLGNIEIFFYLGDPDVGDRFSFEKKE